MISWFQSLLSFKFNLCRYGVAPTVVTFGCLLNTCRVIGGGGDKAAVDQLDRPVVPAGQSDRAVEDVERAYALLDEMTELGVCPNDRCQNALVRVVGGLYTS